MTIPVDIQRESFVGDGATKTFSFDASFVWWNDAELQVYYEDLTTEELTEWRQGINYKLPTGGKGVFGGTILTVAEDALTSNEKVHVLRILPLRHKIDFENGKTIDLESIERSDDRLMAIMQQIDEGITRTIRVPLNEEADFTWPSKQERAGLYLGFRNDTEAEPYAAPEPDQVSLGANLTAIQNQITPAASKLLQWTGAGTVELIDTASLTGGQLKDAGSYTFPEAPSSLEDSYIFTGLPSGVSVIFLSFQNLSVDSNVNAFVRLGDSGGIESTGYDYDSIIPSVPGPGGTYSANTTGFLIQIGTTATPAHGTIILARINATHQWAMSGTHYLTSAASPFGGGDKTLSAELTQVEITAAPAGAAFASGTVNLQYLIGA